MPWTPAGPRAPWQVSVRAPHAEGCRGPGQPWSSGQSRGPGGGGPLGGSDHLEIERLHCTDHPPWKMRQILKFQPDQACMLHGVFWYQSVLMIWGFYWGRAKTKTCNYPAPHSLHPSPSLSPPAWSSGELWGLRAVVITSKPSKHVIKLDCLTGVASVISQSQLQFKQA